MDLRQFDQPRQVNPYERPIAEQELEPRGAVVGDHQVRGHQIRRQIVPGREDAPALGQHRRETRHPVDASGVAFTAVARPIVQLYQHVDRQCTQAFHEVQPEHVQRRRRGPGRRIEDRRSRGIQAQPREHLVA